MLLKEILDTNFVWIDGIMQRYYPRLEIEHVSSEISDEKISTEKRVKIRTQIDLQNTGLADLKAQNWTMVVMINGTIDPYTRLVEIS